MAGKPADDFDVRLGARIREARKGKGASQRELADAIGVSHAQFQKYEQGINRMTVRALQTVAAVLGMEPASFFDQPAQ